MRKTLLDGLGFAVAAKRERLQSEDIKFRTPPGKRKIGF
jgi:hypothetical protein